MKGAARFVAPTGALIAILTALAVLASWTFSPDSKEVFALFLRTMRPSTAVCLILAGCSLLLPARHSGGGGGIRRIAWILSAAICVIAFACRMPGIPAFLRMGALNSISQCLIAVALVASGRKLGLFAAMGAAFFAVLALVEYLYAAQSVYEPSPYQSMAVSTAVCVLSLCVGILFSERHQALSAVLFADSAGAAVARRALPASLFLPTALGGILLLGERWGWYPPQFGHALFAVILTLGCILFVILSARHSGEAERLRNATTIETRARQAQLASSEARLQTALLAVSAASFDFDLATRELFWSEGFHSLFGADRTADYSGWISAIHPEDVDRTIAESRQGIQRGEGGTAYRIVRDGEIRWIEALGRRIGENRFVGLTIDVTERKRAETELRQYRDIFYSASQAISISLGAAVSGFAKVNPSYARMHGYEVEDMIGMDIERVYPRRALDDMRKAIRLAGETGYHALETRHIRRDGSEFPVQLDLTAVKDESGQVSYYISNVRDLTESKRMEEHLRETAKLESIGVLAGGIAHDFNNILTGILGNASLLEHSLPAGSEFSDIVQIIMRSSERAADLVRQMLAYSGRGQFVVKLLDLSAKIRETSALISTLIPRSADLELRLESNLPPIQADAIQVQQVIMNLIINAAEALGEKPGRVTVTTAATDLDETAVREMNSAFDIEPGRYVQLRVADDGSGMDQATVSRIFDPFFTTKFTGRGLGLSAVLGIVRGHRGSLKVQSEPGAGTVFDVYFPAASGYIRPDAETKPPARGRGTVLIVDDEELILHTSKSMLDRAGYCVLCSNGGPQALEIFRARHAEIDIVLLDMSMPGMSGEEVLGRLQEIRPEVRVVLSSGYGEPEAIAKFKDKGLAGFLQKPYTSSVLAETLAKLS